MCSLLAGCPNGCPDGYQACDGRCYKRIEQVVNFWTAAGLCEAESIRIHGWRTDYITIPSPWNESQNNCIKQFAREAAVWLGFIEVDHYDNIWRDYKLEYYLTWRDYSDWAFGQPNAWVYTDELHIVLIPNGWYVSAGWHDWKATALFHPLCATRFCHKL